VIRRLSAALGVGLAAWSTAAATPKLEALAPPGGRQGETVAPVLLIGKSDKWPVKTWCSHPDISITPDEQKNRLKIAIGKGVPAGPHLVRIYDENGASDARPFVVGTLPELVESGNNDNGDEAEAVKSLPVVINGRLERNGDSDFYRVQLKAGQLFTARLDGYSLGSLIDPFINLFDPRGYEIAVASDTHNLDPFLQHRVAADGEYRLQIFAIAHKASTSVGYSGSAAAVYRLQLTADEKARLGLPITARRQESEGGALEADTSVAGVISRSGESDEYTFAAKKGTTYTVRVEALRWHYVWDPVLTVHRSDGRLLREVDDSRPSADPEYTFKAALDGDHKVTITDRFRSGGEEHRYRLVVEPAKLSVEATIDKDRFELEAGKSVELKLKLDRANGHNAALTAQIADLPSGVSLEAKPIDGKAKSATLKLVAAADADTSSGPFHIRLQPAEGDAIAVHHSFVTGESRGDYLINETRDLWLTIKPAKKPTKPAAGK
jgi:hypothetical protein